MLPQAIVIGGFHVTTLLAIFGRIVPWLGLALATAAVSALCGGWFAALACGGYLLADNAYAEALAVIERFAPPLPPLPPPDRNPE